jgi:hypothetical protein
MNAIPAFSAVHAVCPKCQRAVDDARYCSGDGRHGRVVPDCQFQSVGEHLHRVCACGYWWVERCADAGEAAEREVDRVMTGLGSTPGTQGTAPKSAASKRSETARAAPVARGGADQLPERPIERKPAGAPGGIAGRASEREREDPVTLASDESFPASDPPGGY